MLNKLSNKQLSVILIIGIQSLLVVATAGQRGQFVVGGEWLVFPVLFLGYHILKIFLSSFFEDVLDLLSWILEKIF